MVTRFPHMAEGTIMYAVALNVHGTPLCMALVSTTGPKWAYSRTQIVVRP